MADRNPGQALQLVNRIALLCDFIEHPAIQRAAHESVPVSMPADVGSLGFDTPLWVGLGTVGLWAALDAFADRADPPKTRCATCGRGRCIRQRFADHVQGNESQALAELDDLRHLYAHNFAGDADGVSATYPRHVLVHGTPAHLACGVWFNGHNVQLGLTQLKWYAGVAPAVLQRFP